MMPFAILSASLRLFAAPKGRAGRGHTFTLQNCNSQLRQFSQLYTSSRRSRGLVPRNLWGGNLKPHGKWSNHVFCLFCATLSDCYVVALFLLRLSTRSDLSMHSSGRSVED